MSQRVSTTVFPPALISLLFTTASTAGSLPDTGQARCDDGSNTMVACGSTNTGDTATMPRQDGRFGRDPAAGDTGFDYVKVCNSGELADSGSCPSNPSLGEGANDWACTQDNITGLMWEVKVNNSSHLRHYLWTYSWYDSNSTTNGGDAGEPDSGVGVGSDDCFNSSRCDTEKYVADVNGASLCGYSDWRLPSRRELRSIVHFGPVDPPVDSTHFPNMLSTMYWTASTSVSSPSSAWRINFTGGAYHVVYKSTFDGMLLPAPARLVRGDSF